MSYIFLKAFLAFFVLTVSYIATVSLYYAANDIPVEALRLSIKHKVYTMVLSIGLVVSLPACLFCWVVGL